MHTRKALMIASAAALLAATGACSSMDRITGLFVSKPAPVAAPVVVNWVKTSNGVEVTPSEGPARKVRLVVMSQSIVRVTASPTETIASAPSLIVRAEPQTTPFEVSADGDVLSLKTAKLTVQVSLKTGEVKFLDAAGRPVLTGAGAGQFASVKVDGHDFFAVRAEFNRGTDEGFYGLGQHQNGQMNYNGEDVILAQHNMDVAVPFVVSTRNYGLLWDNYSITRFGYPAEYPAINAQLTLYDAAGHQGGLTARYTDHGRLLAERVEADPNYQFIEDSVNFPPQVANPRHLPVRNGDPVPVSKTLVVTYEGALETQKTGVHKFRFYVSGYFKLWIDGRLVMDSWRQGWQGWYRNIDIPMVAGRKLAIKAEWRPEGGAYLRFLHLDPMPEDERHELSLHSDVADAIDYYYVAGSNLDEVIAGYRHLTGEAALMPQWAYGFWQSRQRYETQSRLVNTFRRYRQLRLPIDAIVQDWRYWRDPEWGSHEFDLSRFPHPQAMFDDIHRMHGHLMIVIWPKFYAGLANDREFDERGLMYRYAVEQDYRDWVGPGYPSSNYDAYSPEARDIYWNQVRRRLDVLGPDAWWMDNDEPDIHSNMSIDVQIKMRGPTAMGPGAEFYNTYPLMHVCGFYDHWQAAHPDQRTFILTRSGFAGVQRCNAAVWSGDIASRWSDMRDQISAGVNFSLSGIPNWTFDIGGYTMEDRFAVHPGRAAKTEWTELYTRWFEFGAFVPVFRSHGELIHRETFEIARPGSRIYNILASYQRLRYRLLPYIYSLAAGTYHRDDTMMRGLVMDFPNDTKVRTIADEYMFGRAFLVAPVTAYRANSRPVYLPAGTRWYDFYTGKVYDGGQTVTAAAPLDRIPLFVPEGAIIPSGPAIQYTGQQPGGPITLTIYTGKDGHFDIYEDDGTSTGYRNGAFARIPVSWSQATGILTIGARQGSFPGMAANRVIKIRWISGPAATAANFDARPAQAVRYSGQAIEVKRH